MRPDQLGIARELNGIASPLFADQQERLSGHRRTVPEWPIHERVFALGAQSPAPLVGGAAGGNVALRQQRDAQTEMGVGVIGRDGNGAPVTRDRLAQASRFMQNQTEIQPGIAKFTVSERASVQRFCLFELVARRKRNA